MAFVLVLHLDPNHVSMMPELLQRITPMKVYQVREGLKLKPNCIYLIPPNKNLSILHGALHLFDPGKLHGMRLPIDIFFRSLANDRQEKSIGIILTGMGSDGSLGLKAIKEKNGIVLVQSPASAKFSSMPSSAIDAVIADIVAPVEELPAKLIAFLKAGSLEKTDPELNKKTINDLHKIIILLREHVDHDFSLYKKNTILRCIERRKSAHLIENVHSYIRFLQETPEEIEILFKELLIGVTSFFRDAAVWEMLKENVLPDLINELPDGYVLRVWVPACSTGEEAYSLAIVFIEVLEKVRKPKNLKVQIYATDLDVDSIEIARKGVYSSKISADVSTDRLARFFIVDAEGYQVIKLIREMVIFAPQNVIKDPPFSRLDMLSCRNMMIYMEQELQNKLMALFNYCLNPGGIVVLGTSETVGNLTEGFEELDRKLKIFRRTVTSPGSTLGCFPSSFNRKKTGTAEDNIMPKAVESIRPLADQVLLQRFAPASVLVNNEGEILYMTGLIGKYLEPIAGEANWNILAIARRGLQQELSGLFRKAMQTFDPVIVRNIKIGTNRNAQIVDVTVQRLETPDLLRGMIMVVFTDVPDVAEHTKLNLKKGKLSPGERQKELEILLQRRDADLQNTQEEMQTTQEELQSTNEELQSTTEELQSTNEELNTSLEEMQSTNEEMQIVNTELNAKIIDIKHAGNDLQNLFNAINIGTLFLDNRLNIRKFNNELIKIVKIRSSDIGRRYSDLATDLQYPEFESNVMQVAKTQISVETTVSTRDGRWFSVKILPYITDENTIDGLVITFFDVSEFKKLEVLLKEKNDSLRTSEIRFRRLFESSKDGMIILDAKSGKITAINEFLVALLGYSHEQLIEKSIWEIGFLKDIIGNKEKFAELQKKKIIRYKDLPLETASGKRINVEFISNVYLVENKEVIQCQIRDIPDPRK